MTCIEALVCSLLYDWFSTSVRSYVDSRFVCSVVFVSVWIFFIVFSCFGWLVCSKVDNVSFYFHYFICWCFLYKIFISIAAVQNVAIFLKQSSMNRRIHDIFWKKLRKLGENINLRMHKNKRNLYQGQTILVTHQSLLWRHKISYDIRERKHWNHLPANWSSYSHEIDAISKIAKF